jgi:phage-related holin
VRWNSFLRWKAKKEVFMFGEWTTEFVVGLLLIAGVTTALITVVVLVDWIDQRAHRH